MSASRAPAAAAAPGADSSLLSSGTDLGAKAALLLGVGAAPPAPPLPSNGPASSCSPARTTGRPAPYPACGDAPGFGEGRADLDLPDETPQLASASARLASASAETPQLEAPAFRLVPVEFPNLEYVDPETPVPGAKELDSYLSPETPAAEVTFPECPALPREFREKRARARERQPQ